MQMKYTSRLPLLLLAFMVAMLVFPAVAFAETVAPDGTTSSSLPTIQSDQADYPPGATVTLTGSNWQPGESVRIIVNDTYGATWKHDVYVTADASGSITDTFSLSPNFVSDYDVTATGAQSGTATTTFTDSQPNSVSVNPATEASKTVAQGFVTTPYPVQTVMGGNSNSSCTVTMSVTTEPAVMQGNTVVQPADTGLPAGTTVNFGNSPFTSSSGTVLTPLVIGTSGPSATTPTPAGTYTFHVKANSGSDCQGGVNSSSVSAQQLTLIVTSANSAPTANAGGPYSVAEGGSVQLSGSGTDTDGTIASYAWDLDNDGQFDDSTAQNPTFSAANIDGPSSRTVRLQVTDNKGATGTSSATVNVTNVAPTATFTAPSSVNQGSNFNISLSGASDPSSADTTAGFQYAFDCGSGSFGAFSGTSTANCTINTGGSATVRGQIKDDDGGISTYTATVSVNSLPSANANGPYNVNEGGSVQLNGSGSDPDQGDTLSYAWDLDNNGTFETTGQTPNFSAASIDGPATRSVVLRVTDSKGATATSSATVNVNNVAPTVTLTGDAVANEGTTHTYTYTVSDPGDDPNPTITEDCGANGTKTDTAAANSFDCTFPDGPASSTVKVTANDGDASNNIGSDSKTVAVANVKPSVVLSGAATADEGQTKTYTYTVSDPGQDTYTALEDCGANGTKTDTAAANSFDCTFPDGPASSDVTVKVTDSDGATDTDNQTVTVTVSNVAPTVVLSGATSANEGDTKTYTYTVSDPGDDSNPTITEDCGANGTKTDTAAANSFDCTFPDGPASSTVKVTADDGDTSNNIGSDSKSVTVSNVAPSISLSGPTTADEGQTKTYTYTTSDPGVDTVSVATDCGTAGTKSAGPTANSFNCTFPDGPATSVVTAKATDSDNATDTDNQSVTVNVANLAPVVHLTAAPTAADEGQTKTYTYTIDDVAADLSSMQVTEDCGTGSTKINTAAANSFDCTFPDGPADPVVKVTATDSNNDSGSDQASVHVSNVAPTTTLSGPTAAVEGQTKTYTYTVSDPGNDTYTTAESCGANGTYTNTAAANSFDCTFSEGPASSNVSVQATDSDNLAGNTASTSVTVSNANPVVGALSITDPKSGVSCLGGNTVNLGFSFTDAGSADTHKATIAWGDGSTNTVVDPATSPVSGKQHTYSGQGPYTITVTVTDDDGGSGSANNSANQTSFHYNVGTTLLSPVNADSSSIFKLGSTIPLKVNITDCNGVGVTGLAPTIKMLLISSNATNTGEIEASSTQPNDTNGVMRDVGGGMYMYNLASSSLPDSTAKYESVITLNGYKVTSQNYFSLKAK